MVTTTIERDPMWPVWNVSIWQGGEFLDQMGFDTLQEARDYADKESKKRGTDGYREE